MFDGKKNSYFIWKNIVLQANATFFHNVFQKLYTLSTQIMTDTYTIEPDQKAISISIYLQ